MYPKTLNVNTFMANNSLEVQMGAGLPVENRRMGQYGTIATENHGPMALYFLSDLTRTIAMASNLRARASTLWAMHPREMATPRPEDGRRRASTCSTCATLAEARKKRLRSDCEAPCEVF